MRFVRHNANADGGQAGLRGAQMIVPAWLLLISGCAMQQTPRMIEGQAALAPLDRIGINSTFVPPNLGSATVGPGATAGPQPPSIASSENSSDPPSFTIFPGRQVAPDLPDITSLASADGAGPLTSR